MYIDASWEPTVAGVLQSDVLMTVKSSALLMLTVECCCYHTLAGCIMASAIALCGCDCWVTDERPLGLLVV